MAMPAADVMQVGGTPATWLCDQVFSDASADKHGLLVRCLPVLQATGLQ